MDVGCIVRRALAWFDGTRVFKNFGDLKLRSGCNPEYRTKFRGSRSCRERDEDPFEESEVAIHSLSGMPTG